MTGPDQYARFADVTSVGVRRPSAVPPAHADTPCTTIAGTDVVCRDASRLPLKSGEEPNSAIDRGAFDVAALILERDHYRQENELLRVELAEKKRELTAMALSLVQKGELLEELRGEITNLIVRSEQRADEVIQPLLDQLVSRFGPEDSWTLFEQQFDSVHQEFLRKLTEQYPGLTPMELKICALSRIGLSTKDIARLLVVSIRNIQNHRYRLRKKLQLESESNLNSFLLGLN